jgi:hypothetical protein
VTKKARALLITGVAVLFGVAMCVVGAVIANRIPGIAGCDERPPFVSGPQDDADRVAELMPALGQVTAAHYRFRDARPRVCPEVGPMTTYYEGFATLAPDRAAALRTGYRWTPARAPDVPDELEEHAPVDAAWQRSAQLDTESRAEIWFDHGSGTVYFSYLRG